MTDAVFTGNVNPPDFVHLTADEVGFEPVEGDPNMRFHELRDSTADGGGVWAGVVLVDPSTLLYTFKGDETIHLLEGDVSVTINEETTVDLTAGDLASFVKGTRSKWVIRSPVKEFFVMAGMG